MNSIIQVCSNHGRQSSQSQRHTTAVTILEAVFERSEQKRYQMKYFIIKPRTLIAISKNYAHSWRFAMFGDPFLMADAE